MKFRALLPLLVLVLSASCAAAAAGPAGALVSTGDGTFFWQTPQPQGNSIVDVSFADAQDLWGVGNAGTILHSSDGGATWAPQQSGSTQDLGGVAFLSLQEGWAVGNGLFHTVDGGSVWTRSAPAGSAYLSGVAFRDANHGWAWGGRHVLRTVDGGATWQLVTASSGGYLLAGSFVTDRCGYVARQDGLVLRTTDGGAHWATLCDLIVNDPDRLIDLVSLSFGDRLHGLATLEDSMTGRSSIVRTTDGGRTWRVAAQFPNGGWSAVRFMSATEVWAASNGGSGSASTILHSTDAGATWSRRTVGRTNLWNIAACGATVCAFGGEVVTSNDGGLTWAERTSGGENFPARIAMADATHGWAAGTRWGFPVTGNGRFADDSAGVILHTSDGVSWTEQFACAGAGGFIKIVCSDADTAWALDQNSVLWHTSDGGAHWARQVSGPEYMTDDVSFANNLVGWMVYPDSGPWGRGSTTMHTIDGGATWTTGHVVAKNELVSVCFVDASHGWLCGGESNSSILRTTDGGGSWHEVTFAGCELDWIRFFDDQHGYAWGWDAKGHNVTLRSSDGGVSWAAVADLAGIGIENLDFCDADHGWAVGFEGLYQTTDGGAHWAITTSGLNGVYDVAAVDAAHVWTAGQGIAATVDTSADTAPPATLDDADGAWRSGAVAVTLSAADIGASGLAGTEYRIDDESTWHVCSGGSVDFPAPADHSGDGAHTLAYRSTDNAGNVEATEYCRVAIDTQRPTPLADRAAEASRGARAALKYSVRDACPGHPTATVTITVRDARGRLAKRFVAKGVAVNKQLAFRFRCELPRGTYRFFVHAKDAAGNRQTKVASNRLTVR